MGKGEILCCHPPSGRCKRLPKSQALKSTAVLGIRSSRRLAWAAGCACAVGFPHFLFKEMVLVERASGSTSAWPTGPFSPPDLQPPPVTKPHPIILCLPPRPSVDCIAASQTPALSFQRHLNTEQSQAPGSRGWGCEALALVRETPGGGGVTRATPLRLCSQREKSGFGQAYTLSLSSCVFF